MVRRSAIPLVLAVLLPLGVGCGTEARLPDSVTLSAADAAASIDQNLGTLTRLRVGKAGVQMARFQPAGFVEVEDLRQHRRYSPRTHPAVIRRQRLTGRPGRRTLELNT